MHSEVLEKATDPGTMGADFKSESCVGVIFAKLAKLLTFISDRFFIENVSILVSDADKVFPVTEIDADIRFELLSVCFIFHRKVSSQIAGAISTPFSFYLFTQEMKHLLIITLLFGVSLIARGEDAKSPEELLVAFVKATGNSDFESIVDDVHPSVLKSFKEHTGNIVKAAIDDFSEEAVLAAFHGLESLGELEKMSEKDFWVYVMGNVYSIFPEFDGAKAVDIVGHVQDGNFLYVLYRRDGDLKSTDKIEKLKSPRTYTFRKNGRAVVLWSFAVSAVEKYVRWQAKNYQPSETNTSE